MLSRALGGKGKRGKERVTHRNFAKKYFLCTSKRHFNVSQSFSLKFCTCLSHKRKLLVCKSQLLFSVGFEIITKIEGAIFFETSCTSKLSDSLFLAQLREGDINSGLFKRRVNVFFFLSRQKHC